MDRIKEILEKIQPVSKKEREKAKVRLDILTKPKDSLGRLEDIAKRYAAICGMDNLLINKKAIFTFAADHGVSEEGVSAFPKEVTAQMVLNFLNGGAAINVLSKHNNADVIVVDMGVDYDFLESPGLKIKKVAHGTKNIMKGPAMSNEEACQAINSGIDLAYEYKKKGYNFFGTGDMGISNTTSSSAIFSVLGDIQVEKVTGRGTGIDDASHKRKIAVIKKAIEVNTPDLSSPIDVLSKVGGFEICGITGLIIGAASLKVPVVVDGFISSAGALAALAFDSNIKDYIFTSHRSVEIGHSFFFEKVGQEPLFDLQMRLGEGTGSAIAMNIIEGAVKVLTQMATFESANVSDSK